jgi:hypothetical protein
MFVTDWNGEIIEQQVIATRRLVQQFTGTLLRIITAKAFNKPGIFVAILTLKI